MEAIKTKGFAKDGLLTVQVPHQFDEQELEVIVLSGKTTETYVMQEANQQERLVRRMSIVGTAKFPNAPIDEYDEYDQ